MNSSQDETTKISKKHSKINLQKEKYDNLIFKYQNTHWSEIPSKDKKKLIKHVNREFTLFLKQNGTTI
jgi:hypothetical protein